MSNKTDRKLTALANAGDEEAQRIFDLLQEAESLKPKSDTDVTTLKKTLAMVTNKAAKEAIQKEIDSRAIGDTEDALKRQREIAEELFGLTTKTISHGYVKADRKSIGDWLYQKRETLDAIGYNDLPEPEEDENEN